MNENPLKRKLAGGEPVFGIWRIMPSPMTSEILGLAGFDFQILDMEHGIFDLHTLDASIRACEHAGSSPLVRVPGVSPFVVQSVLDMGAHGVVFPQVTTVDEVRKAVRCTKYAPDGTRGYNPFTRAALYANPASCEGGKLSNSFGFSSVIIENPESLAVLDEILRVPDLDMVYLGVYDMSVSLGCRGDVRDRRVVEFVESTIGRVRRAGKAAGVMVMGETDAARMLRLGANVLVHGVDSHLIRTAACDHVAALRRTAEVHHS